MRTRSAGKNTKVAEACETLGTLSIDMPGIFSRTRSHYLEKLPGVKSALSSIGAAEISGKTGSRKKGGEARAKNSQKTNYTIFLNTKRNQSKARKAIVNPTFS